MLLLVQEPLRDPPVVTVAVVTVVVVIVAAVVQPAISSISRRRGKGAAEGSAVGGAGELDATRRVGVALQHALGVRVIDQAHHAVLAMAPAADALGAVVDEGGGVVDGHAEDEALHTASEITQQRLVATQCRLAGRCSYRFLPLCHSKEPRVDPALVLMGWHASLTSPMTTEWLSGKKWNSRRSPTSAAVAFGEKRLFSSARIGITLARMAAAVESAAAMKRRRAMAYCRCRVGRC